MASYNKVILMGNLTRDPDVRTTPAGLKIAKFGLAVNRRYRTRDNELKEETTFVDIDAFGQQAETLERYCQKGSPLFVEGRLRLDQWQTNTGENRSRLTVVLENFRFLGGGRSDESVEESPAGHAAARPPAAPKAAAPQQPADGAAFQEDEDTPL